MSLPRYEVEVQLRGEGYSRRTIVVHARSESEARRKALLVYQSRLTSRILSEEKAA